MVVVNLLVALFLFWLVTADRIFFDDGKLVTEELTKKKIGYVIVLWIELVICAMVYSMQQINHSPILPHEFNKSFIIARVVIIITLIICVLYIAYRYGQICSSDEPKLWRSYIFIVFSVIFILALFIMVASNSFVPY